MAENIRPDGIQDDEVTPRSVAASLLIVAVVVLGVLFIGSRMEPIGADVVDCPAPEPNAVVLDC